MDKLLRIAILLISLSKLTISNIIHPRLVHNHNHHNHGRSHSDSLEISPTISRALENGKAPVHLTSHNANSNHNVIWGIHNSWKELRCLIDSSPVAEFEWKFNGVEISEDDPNILTISDNNLSLLKVKLTPNKTIGEYTCRASNILGASEKNFFIRMGKKPMTPVFNLLSIPGEGILVNVTGFHEKYKETLHILPTANGRTHREEFGEVLPIKGYTIQIKVFRSCEHKDIRNGMIRWKHINSSLEKKLIRKNLIPGTTYWIRVATKTDAGLSEYARAQKIFYSAPEINEDGDILAENDNVLKETNYSKESSEENNSSS